VRALEKAVELAVAAENSDLIFAPLRLSEDGSHLILPNPEEVRYFSRRTVDLTSREKNLLN
jgi:hypothetical protein